MGNVINYLGKQYIFTILPYIAHLTSNGNFSHDILRILPDSYARLLC